MDAFLTMVQGLVRYGIVVNGTTTMQYLNVNNMENYLISTTGK